MTKAPASDGKVINCCGDSLTADSQQTEQFTVLGDDATEAEILKQVQEDTNEDCLNSVIVNGMECTLFRKGMFYCLSHNDSAEETTIKSGASIVPQAAFGNYSADINIIWAGTNDRATPETVSKTIENIQTMIDYLGSERYIVVGLTALSYMPEVEKVNQALADAFGEHFYDFRSYVLKRGLKDAGIKATKEDKKDIPDAYQTASAYFYLSSTTMFLSSSSVIHGRKAKRNGLHL